MKSISNIYNYNKKSYNFYMVTFIVHKNSIYKNIQSTLRNIIKKVLEDNGYYYFGTTLYIKYVFNNYNMNFGILSFWKKNLYLKV
ncbi:hypothetical protein [uncultured Brachyspira sp.]|uniref:hypothetical protein n=1 Tax=uncultured Brachyspira sp. TaxID=221953 RepID=UPI0025831626|nr:hypothetical protein [uncultured Brachyspira sp.]